MDTIAVDRRRESDRVAALTSQLDEAAAQIASMRAAIAAANGNVTDDATQREALQRQLDAAAKRLRTVQTQLRGAQSRLAQLNAAADRQAALNAAARAAGASASKTSGGGHGGDDDEGSPMTTERDPPRHRAATTPVARAGTPVARPAAVRSAPQQPFLTMPARAGILLGTSAAVYAVSLAAVAGVPGGR